MALTFEQEAEIRRRLGRGDKVFRIANDLAHSPRTVRERKKKLKEELGQTSKAESNEAPAAFVPVDLGLLLEMAAEKAIDLDYQVLLPVSLEVAAQYVEIQKFFDELKPLMDKAVEAVKQSLDE